ncbi:restriction endonuclease subunit S [Photobacterium damselae]|uniref:restriction endonuclease subunit S n=1 Tax=Photobacterium damselae TaxID=38293 RepID=UPI0025439B37
MSGMKFIDNLLKDVEVEWRPIGELGELVRGNGLPKSDFTESGVPAIHYGQIYTYYGLSTKSTISFVSTETAAKLKKVNTGDIIITNTSENFEDVGKSLVYLGKEQAVTGGHATIFKPNSMVLSKYFAYFTQTVEFCSSKRKFAKGIKVVDVSATDLSKILIPIPCPKNPEKSLEIQAEIVRVLDSFSEKTKALTSELQTELNLRKKQYDHYRDQLFSFQDGEVEWKTLDELAENLDSKRKPIKSGLREAGDIPYYGASGIVDYVKDYIFDGDYLLVSEDGANLLARSTPIAFSISGKTWVNNHAHVLDFATDVERKYVEYFLNSIDLSPYISGAAQPKLNKKNLNAIKIPNPSFDIKEKIVTTLDSLCKSSISIKNELNNEMNIRQQQYEYYREHILSFKKQEETVVNE